MELRIFVSSPSDVLAERDKVDDICRAITSNVGYGEPHITVLRWERLLEPGVGRTQEMIMAKAGSFEVFVAILWSRFGSTTGHDGIGAEISESGTVEEIWRVFDWVKEGKIRGEYVLFYQCTRDVSIDSDFDQVSAVQRLFKDIESQRKAIITKYKSVEDFEAKFTKHLKSIVDRVRTAPQVLSQPPKQIPQFILDHSPLPEVHQLRPRDMLREQLRDKLRSPHGGRPEPSICVLYGPSGAGKSVLAAQYFEETAETKKWVECKSTLEPYVNGVVLGDLALVILDGFDDSPFCWRLLDAVSARSKVIVTCVERTLAGRILRRRQCSVEHCMIEVGSLDLSDWEVTLAEVIGARYPHPFGRVVGRLRGLPAGLRLLCLVLSGADDPKQQLFAIDSALDERAELSDDTFGDDKQGKTAFRWAPEPYLASLYWKKNEQEGDLMRVVSTVPMLGMSSRTLSEVLGCELAEITSATESLQANSFLGPLHVGSETLWVPRDYYRDAFSKAEVVLAVSERERIWVSRYVDYCRSGLSEGLVTKLDAAFVGASAAFASNDLWTITYALRECIDSIDKTRGAQRLSETQWVTIADALMRRARTCSQVIPMTQTLSRMSYPHAKLGDLAWGMVAGDDWWADATAVFAAIRHWMYAPGDRAGYVDRLKERLSDLLESDLWFSNNARHPLSEIVPALLLGGIGILGSVECALKEVEEESFRRRFARSTFVHLVPILQASDHVGSGETARLLTQYWGRVRGGACKAFASEYLNSLMPDLSLKDEGGSAIGVVNPRFALAQAAFSRGALDYLSERVRLPNKRFRGETQSENILGDYAWIPKPRDG
jgi:hypothetical protein